MSVFRLAPFSRLHRQVMAVGIADALAYRGALLVEAAFTLIPLVTSLLLWSAVYDTGGEGIAPGGFTRNAMLSYYLLNTILRVSTVVEDVSFQVTLEVRDGTLNKFLMRPLNYLLYHWHLRMGQILMSIAMLALPAGLVIAAAHSVLVVPQEGWRWAAFLFSVVMGVQVGFLISYVVGLCAFWLLETSAFLHAMFPIQLMLSGGWFPLELLPPGLFALLNALPWAYQTYLPMRIYLGIIGPEEVALQLLIQAGWVAGLGSLAFVLWRRGLRRYAAVGG